MMITLTAANDADGRAAAHRRESSIQCTACMSTAAAMPSTNSKRQIVLVSISQFLYTKMSNPHQIISNHGKVPFRSQTLSLPSFNFFNHFPYHFLFLDLSAQTTSLN